MDDTITLEQAKTVLSNFGINERQLCEHLLPSQRLKPTENGIDLILAQALTNQHASSGSLLSSPSDAFLKALDNVDPAWIVSWVADVVSKLNKLSPTDWLPILPLYHGDGKLEVSFGADAVEDGKVEALVNSSIKLVQQLHGLETADFVEELKLANVPMQTEVVSKKIVAAIESGRFGNLSASEEGRAANCVLLASAMRGSQFGRLSAAADELRS
eukprot:m.8719 g.8719  ORF g.8719 m.8719 type:complete len:215 (-) comp9257_c0_seq1:168-812(-)